MSPWQVLAMALAGGLGAAARFVVDGLVKARARSHFPAGTLTVNLLGSFVLGLVTGAVASGADARLSLVAGTGFCGGFTTFSTASVEAVRLLGDRRPRTASAAVILNVVGCVALAWAGLIVTS